MKRNTKIVLASITAAAIVTGTAAMAAGGQGRMGDRMIGKLTSQLELNDQQVADLQSLTEEISETRELMRTDMGADGQTLKSLIGADSFDQGAALEMITARTTAMQSQGPELVAATAQFLDGLSAEQKQELNELMDRFSNRRGGSKRHGNDK